MATAAGDGQVGLTDDTVAVRPAVKVTDHNGQPIAGISVTFAPGPNSGRISVDTATTGVDGRATAGSWTLGFIGANSLTASGRGLGNSPVYFSATALDLLVLSHAGGFNQSTKVGTAVAVPPGVLVVGAFSAAPIVGATVTFTVTDGGGSITGGTTTTNAQGIATVGSWTLGIVPGPNHLTATVSWPGSWSLTTAATGTP